MCIKDVKIFVCCPGRNFVTVKIITDNGIYGLGDATVNGREMAVVAYLTEHVVPCLIGRDAHTIEDTWQYLYRDANWRRGTITMAAIAAIDLALWDIREARNRFGDDIHFLHDVHNRLTPIESASFWQTARRI